MDFQQIISELKQKKYHPIYFLTGDEPYFIDIISNYIAKNVLTDQEKEFNQTVLYGKDTDMATIINTAKRYPMMATHQVVIVKEAQEIGNMDLLIHYLEKPLNSTILVFNYKYKNLDNRKNLTKTIKNKTLFFESKKLYDDKIPGWINSFLKARKKTITPEAAVMLTEFLGNDLSKIANEIEKLIITLPPEIEKITPTHVEKNIGISKDYNNFELQKAIGTGNVIKANQIVNYFGNNPKQNPMALTIASLYGFFSKVLRYHLMKNKADNRAVTSALQISPYFIRDYQQAARRYPPAAIVRNISLLREFDLKSKGVNNASTPPEELLKELIFKIMH
ncbi:MAG: DNA polymerase III subunit delta [Bacteroidota bacterium]